MTAAQSLLNQIVSHKDTLRSYNVNRVGIFGSYARGEEKDTSDIDVIVEFDPGKKTYRNFYNTALYLETFLKRPVDLVTSQALSPYIKPYILKDIQYVPISS